MIYMYMHPDAPHELNLTNTSMGKHRMQLVSISSLAAPLVL